MLDDTIFALATASGRAGVAVIRVSGPDAATALRLLGGSSAPIPRRATRVRFVHPSTGESLDDGLALWFPGPASFTGEDVIEFHTHGGPSVVADILDALSGLLALRIAEPGEFTRRAFENGKMDLTMAEGLADLVAAETSAQRRQALRQMDGALTNVFEGWRTTLVGILANLEAIIDFIEDDLPHDLLEQTRYDIVRLVGAITTYLNDSGRGERLRDGINVAIIGPPNAGKSSLLNRLARRDVAIVSAIAGTTRDVIDIRLDVGGFPVILSDMAGLCVSHEEIESEGVRRALVRATTADLKLAVFDGAMWPAVHQITADFIDDDTIVIVNKADLLPQSKGLIFAERQVLTVSALLNFGIEELLLRLEQEVSKRWAPLAEPSMTRSRHRIALQECKHSLERSLTAPLLDLMAEDIRLAARSLGRITGIVDVEELLDVIFREFCIGK